MSVSSILKDNKQAPAAGLLEDYEDYWSKSKTYTALREPVGWEKQLAWFEGNPHVALAEQRLLDAGCGTGNYSCVFLPKFQAVHLYDYNGGMLEEARKNVEEVLGTGDRAKAKFEIGSITDLNAPDASYDSICNNQVVHHLRPDNDFADLRDAAREFHRVLRPGGRLCINFSTPSHNSHGFWWAELIPRGMGKINTKSPTEAKMKEVLSSAGFAEVHFEDLKEEIMYPPALYFNPENFLDPTKIRLSSSEFSLSDDQEMAEAEARVRRMKAEGSLGEWFAHKEEERKAKGQSVNVYAVKSL